MMPLSIPNSLRMAQVVALTCAAWREEQNGLLSHGERWTLAKLGEEVGESEHMLRKLLNVAPTDPDECDSIPMNLVIKFLAFIKHPLLGMYPPDTVDLYPAGTQLSNDIYPIQATEAPTIGRFISAMQAGRRLTDPQDFAEMAGILNTQKLKRIKMHSKVTLPEFIRICACLDIKVVDTSKFAMEESQ